MVDALQRIHGALVPGGVVVDAQPVSARPPIVSEAGELGTLDMTEWMQTIAAVDERIQEVIAAGLFVVTGESHYPVADTFDDGAELVATTSGWVGTRVEPEVARRVEQERGRVSVREGIRMRLLVARAGP